MDLGLGGRRVIVGGASRGIGLAIVRAFLAEGADVALLARDAARLAQVSDQLRNAHPHARIVDRAVDLCDADATAAAVGEATAQLGGLDCVIANAGSGVGAAGWAIGTEEWARLLAENLATAVNLCRAAADVVNPGGALTLIASLAGLRHLPAPLPYAAAKAAVIRYGKDLAHALAPRAVRVNVVAPGNVLFEGGRWEQLRAEDPVSVDGYIAGEVPLARFGTPEEVAAAVVFLCSPSASFITGACLAVDGGQAGD